MLRIHVDRAAGPLKLLCLGAHSDDIEIGCGGTVLRLLAEHPGAIVHWIVFSTNPEREAEARASAADFLAQAGSQTVTTLRFRESFFPADWAAIKDELERLRRTFDPELVLCHRLDDMHQDHRVIGELAWNTFRDHLIWSYEIPKYEGDLGTSNVFVPLSREQAERKVALLHQHFVSQRERAWFRPDTFHGLMSVRGIECNAPDGRAEAFHARKLVF